MNFTREPVIETIISPKDGFKLIIRSSNGDNSKQYSVDAVEVVSFGQSFFFRSMERSKSFLVPVSDFEVIEERETRVVVKNPSPEKSIKIAGGKENTSKKTPSAKKKTKKKKEAPPAPAEKPIKKVEEEIKQEVDDAKEFVSKLLPPPTGLISDTIIRYKEAEEKQLSEAQEDKSLGEEQRVEVELEKEEKKLDEIWNMDDSALESETPPPQKKETKDKRSLKKRVKKPAAHVEEVEETNNVIIEEPPEPVIDLDADM